MKNELSPPIPDYMETPKELFRDLDHYKLVYKAIINSMAHSKSKRSSSKGNSYFYSSIRICFSQKITAEEVELDPFESAIILHAPKFKHESRSSLQSRRLEYIANLMKPLEAMKITGISQLYLAIQPDGRRKLEQL